MTNRPDVPSLHIKNLKIESARGRILLSVNHLQMNPGQTLAIRGPSGAGKSTLLFAMAGLLPVKEGILRWGNFDLATASDEQRTPFRRQTIGIVFQDHLLFEELSAADNAALASLYAPRIRRDEVARRADCILQELGLGSESRRRADSFSGGERQRIAVARALAANPPVVLADEPTANLDRANADRLICDLFGQARQQGRTLIAVSHDPSLIQAADRVVEIVDGVLSGEATHSHA